VNYSGFINRSVNLSTDTFIASGRKLSVRGRYNESDARSLPDDSGGEQYAVIRKSEERRIRESSIGLTYNHDISSDVSFTVTANSFIHDEQVDSPGVAPGVRDPFGIPANTSDSKFIRHYLLWNNNFEVSSDIQLSAGLDLQREYGSSDSVLDTGFGLIPGSYNLKRKNRAVFMEALFGKGENLITKVAVRHDMPEGFDSETTASIGLRYSLYRHVFSVSVGSGYKLPSFFALGNPIVGNPGLAPEKSTFWEAGIKQTSEDLSFEWHLNIYAYKFEDLVDFDSGPPPSLVNRSKVTSEGVEVGARQQINKNNFVSAELAYSETNIVGSNEKLLNRPLWKATAQYRHDFSGALTSTASLVYVDEVYESSIATGDLTLDAYTRLDLSLNWQYSKKWRLGGVIENLTDESYQQTVGTDSPGRTVFVSLTVNL
jgi:iron complex outermembrane receptor protein/vitamin B12 transporter